jgi:antitoxin component YwqK of YwqJK toxin-antitoxin module
MKSIYFTIFFALSVTISAKAQTNLKSQIPTKKRYAPIEVLNEQFGIRLYEKLNGRIGGDSVRNDCKGYACTGWVNDYYVDGSLLHRGYYDKGKLTIYKNYYPNGQLESDFRTVDDIRGLMTKFYASGQKKSFVKYVRDSPIIWEDYYENGKLEYREEFHKSFEYYLEQSSYYENGNLESQTLLENKKKLVFTKKDYFENGKVKYEGELHYDRNMLDYVKKGKWISYNQDGTAEKEELFINGVLEKEKSL